MSLLLGVSSVVPSLWMCPFAYLPRPSIAQRAGFVDVVLAGPRPAPEAARRLGGLMQNLLLLDAYPEQDLRQSPVLQLSRCELARTRWIARYLACEVDIVGCALPSHWTLERQLGILDTHQSVHAQ